MLYLSLKVKLSVVFFLFFSLPALGEDLLALKWVGKTGDLAIWSINRKKL